ncbi:flippase [Candidatus Woesearchaeota archaeon]|nr:flippase [Candidatus Woesearchaeota archaeon]
MKNYTKKAVSGVSMVFSMGILASVIAYFLRIVMVRALSPEEYGLFTAVFTFVMFFLFFRDLGMGQALSKHIPEFIVNQEPGKIKSGIFFVTGFQLLTSLILGFIFFLLNNFLSANYFKNPNSKSLLTIIIFYIVGSVLFRMYKAIASGYQEMKLYSIFELLKNIAVLLLFILFFNLGFGLNAAALAWTVGCYLIIILTTPVVLRIAPILTVKINNFWPTAKRIMSYSIPLITMGIAGKIISSIDTLMLTYYMPLTAVGIYNVVLPSAMIFLDFGSSVSAVLFPMVSELWARSDVHRMSEGLKLLHKYLFFIVIPPALGIIAFSKFLLLTFFGVVYAEGALALQILVIGMLIYVVATVNISILSAIGKAGITAKITVVSAVFNIALNLLLIPILGIEGAALTTAFSYAVSFIWSTIILLRYIPIKLPINIWLKLIFAGFVFYSIVKYLQINLQLNPSLKLIVSISIGLLVYGLIAYAYQIIDISEIKKYYHLLIRKD